MPDAAPGLALEKLVDPDAVPDGLSGDLLVRENPSVADQGIAGTPQELPAERQAAQDG
jgi:hypothetical protein